jgi:plastocyanin
MKRFAFLSMVVSVFIFGSAVVYAGDTTYQNMDDMSMQNMPTSSGHTSDTAQSNITDPSLALVTIKGFVFASSDVRVPMGTTVRWTNEDNVVHTVTADTTGGPSSGQLKPGQSYSFKFNQAGTFHYHCAIHPAMTGSITVSGPSAPATSAENSTSNFTNTTTPNDSSADNSTTSNSNSNENEQTTIVQTQPIVSSATAPAVLANTGPGGILPIFVLSSILGASLYTIYTRKKSFRG